MKRPRTILVIAIIASVTTTLVLAWPREKEPTYKGRSLSQWLQLYREHAEGKIEAEQAVREIGTNALPWLLKWVGHRPPAWSRAVGYLHASWNPANRAINAVQTHLNEIALMRWRAAFGFQILGDAASNAAPQLVKMLDADNPGRQWPHDTWPPPAYALSRIGDTGIKPLLDWVSDPRSLARNEQGVTSTIRCLGQITGNRTNTDRIISILVEGMRSSNQGIAISSALALSGMDLDPSTVVETLRIAAARGNVSSVRIFLQCLAPTRLAQPEVKSLLLQFQNDPDPIVQNAARTALDRIPTEALATNRLDERPK